MTDGARAMDDAGMTNDARRSKPGPDAIAARIRGRLPDARVDVADDSHLHVGHTGAAGGGGHYAVTVVSGAFAGLGRIARHRLVYDALADWMPARIHALAVRALTPAESERAADAPDGASGQPSRQASTSARPATPR